MTNDELFKPFLEIVIDYNQFFNKIFTESPSIIIKNRLNNRQEFSFLDYFLLTMD